MTASRHGLDWVIARFPDLTPLIRRRCLSDPAFRILCEEYALAHICLTRFQNMGKASHAAEIEDYLSVISALEGEIARFLKRFP